MRIESIKRKMSPLGRLVFGLAVSLGLILNSSPEASAHKVFIHAWFDGDTIYTESYFGAKRKVKGGLILVFDPSGKKLLEGRTNEKGEFSFKAPQKTDLRIVVEAGMGHRNECILKAEEDSRVPGGEAKDFKADNATAESMPLISVGAEQIKALVEQALDARLKPIKHELAAIRKEKSIGITEIIGGIGYIFGLMGLVMYFRSRGKDG